MDGTIRDTYTAALCGPCAGGPARIDGHALLGVQAVGGSQMSFRCSACQALWSRRYLTRGAFSWIRIPEATAESLEMGISVPPRTNPAPVFPWRGSAMQ